MAGDMSHTRGMKTRRSMYRASCGARLDVCWICSERIDYSVETGTTAESFTIDHYWPQSSHPELAVKESNWRPAHRYCNSRRYNRHPELWQWIGTRKKGRWVGIEHLASSA